MRSLLLILSVLSVSIGCDNILPLPTKNGANTFGCKVNGSVLKTTKYNLLRDNPLFARMTDSSLYIAGNDYDSKLKISIRINKIYKKGDFIIDDKNCSGGVEDGNFPTKYYITNQKYTGSVQIKKFDKEKNIVSGTFSFEAVRINNRVSPNRIDSTDVLKITNGRFDIDFDDLKK
jgi:hypothetical protein